MPADVPAGNAESCDGLTVMPCVALLFSGSTVQLGFFFPGKGHHHVAVGYNANIFIFPVEVLLLPMKNLDSLDQKRAKRREMCLCSLMFRACI